MKTKTKKIVVISLVAVVTVLTALTAVFLVRRHNESMKNEERAKLVKEYYDAKIAKYEEENRLNPEIDVVFLGDSLTDGCDLGKYYPEYTCFNRGIGGDTTSGLLNRLKVSAYDTAPKVVVLLIGGNDVLGGKSLESIYENYDEIISGLKRNLPNAKIVWCSLTAMGNRWAKHNDTAIICNQKIKLMANKYGCEFVDLFTPLCDEATGEIFKNYTVEGVHFTDEGYIVVSGEIKKAIRGVLE